MTLQMCEEAAMAAIALQAARRQPERPTIAASAACLGPIDPDVISTAIPALGKWVLGRTGARFRGFPRPVSQARPPNRTCASPRIRLSTRSRWLGGSGGDARPR